MSLTLNFHVRTILYKTNRIEIFSDGEICVLNPKGEMIGKVPIPEFPEIVGMHFSKQKTDIMYITENSGQPTCLRV